MAKVAGRAAVLSKNGTPIGGVRVSTISRGTEAIDVSDRDSAGLIELLSVGTGIQLTLEVEGVYEDPVLRDIAMGAATSQLLTDLTFKFADALAASDTISGNFFMTSYEEDNPYDDTSTFTATFVSSGAWTVG